MHMFERGSRGPKTSKWKHGARAAFGQFFARRAEPLNAANAETRPLVEATSVQAGRGWAGSRASQGRNSESSLSPS